MADLNDALDWYFQLAFEADSEWTFDDINNTNPPIDTQNLVSGTNRYKVSSFTEKIFKLLKLEVLDSSGAGQSLTPETMDILGTSSGAQSGVISGLSSQSFQEAYLNAPSGVPTHYVKYGDFIYLRPKPNYSYASGLKAYFNRPASKFSFVPFTVTIATPGVFTATAHGLTTGDTVILETDGALPSGLSVDTTYYVISTGLTADTFRLATTSGGSAINTTGTQSGNHAFLKTNAEPGITPLHHMALCRKAALTYLNFTNSNRLGFLPAQVIKDEQVIKDHYGTRGADLKPQLVAKVENNR